MVPDVKRCPGCEDTLPSSSFYRNTTQRDRLSSYCKGCCVARSAAWRKANPQKHREYQATWYRANPEKARAREKVRVRPRRQGAATTRQPRPVTPPHILAAKRKVRATEYRKAHPDKHRAAIAMWTKKNPVARAAMVARRRAAQRAAPGRGVSAAEWATCLVESLGTCAYCNERKPLTMDHIEPLAKGGAHDIDNIVAACLSCNSSKHDRPLLLWLATKSALNAALRQKAA